MSPERIGSPQDESGCSLKMSVPASPVAGTPIRDAQSPISLLLAVAQAQNQNRTNDDDLTSLSWLHEKDLLKGMNINPSPSGSISSTPKRSTNGTHSNSSPTSDYIEDFIVSPSDSSNSSTQSTTICPNLLAAQQQQRNKHPHNIPYDPLVHTHNKPPYSFSCLIFMAIEESKQKALPVKDIYAWIMNHFPYFLTAPVGWKNSVRHNLSLNKCFQKIEKAPNFGKGSLWTIDPQFKPSLIQALTRSPFHPCSTLDPALYATINKINSPESPSSIGNQNAFSYLSNKMNGKNADSLVKKEYCSDDSLDAADAAAVMLSLKNGPSNRQVNGKTIFQIITTSPSQDHTYSAAGSNSTSSEQGDEAFESDDDRIPRSSTCRKIDFEDDEDRKTKEGAETLLNLAGVGTRKRLKSSTESEPRRMKLCNYTMESAAERTPFKPRMLRPKKRAGKKFVYVNNNNNDWVKHRKELDMSSER